MRDYLRPKVAVLWWMQLFCVNEVTVWCSRGTNEVTSNVGLSYPDVGSSESVLAPGKIRHELAHLSVCSASYRGRFLVCNFFFFLVAPAFGT
jgi:hypothetical protein